MNIEPEASVTELPHLAHAPLRALCVHGDTPCDMPAETTLSQGGPRIVIDCIHRDSLENYLANFNHEPPAVVVVLNDSPAELPAAARAVRRRPELHRTRLYLFSSPPAPKSAQILDVNDIEDCFAATDIAPDNLIRTIRNGVRAFRALGDNRLVPKYYLDAKYNDVFTWFEKSRWDWSEAGDLSRLDRNLLTEEEIAITRQACIAEFGTLPGTHNFLREWFDEYSFSSWAVAWGAEESRHALVLARCLRELGIEVPAKHAMYKRAPYPSGPARSATLMMNMISESRASEYYKCLYRSTREPVLKNIWRLLSRDESRHAAAFFAFCQEACRHDNGELIAALEMAYVWLADRRHGLKHPAGFFYPHSSSTHDFRETELYLQTFRESVTDDADARVFAMIRKLTRDNSIFAPRDIRVLLRRSL